MSFESIDLVNEYFSVEAAGYEAPVKRAKVCEPIPLSFDQMNAVFAALGGAPLLEEGTRLVVAGQGGVVFSGKSLSLKKDAVERLLGPVVSDPSLKERTVSLIVHEIMRRKTGFPYPNLKANKLVVKLLSYGKYEAGEGATDIRTWAMAVEKYEAVPSCEQDRGRSHLILSGQRWAANHDYSEFWTPLTDNQGRVLVIDNPSGSQAPGRLIDACTYERFNSSWVGANHVSPADAWDTEEGLTRIVRKLVNGRLRDGQKKFTSKKTPIKYTGIRANHFLKAALNEFPCSFHFPPTAMIGTIHHLFQAALRGDATRMLTVLDTSAGHGHRLAAAVACDRVGMYNATDPNTRMRDGYREIFVSIVGQMVNKGKDCFLQLDYPSERETWGHSCGTKRDAKRFFYIREGVSEDPKNPIYYNQAQKVYDLAFSSPPFFNTEAYGDGQNQSINYKSFKGWIRNFLRPTLLNTVKVMKPGGFVALNLTDSAEHPTIRKLMKIMTRELGCEYLGMIASRKAIGAAQRFEGKMSKIQHGIDPIWVFQVPDQ